ncbi:hypothetical protein P5G65_35635 [Paenibacillus chondroitinus]|uniref:Uncharacterized protein n=1 Tax=Paenibacillus chondroitinus TaxID=59842 RepID=A0ABU6DN40_9BACL|nr:MULTISPECIES: hypothetical protein [Paenibacillus]MCY9663128.1 hypothetical protein [Paenibacillus anseongense]MEB4799199.1 hypothetical protein [Paenibacillus chondroitinus]
MSYDVHITKADHWLSSEQYPITPDDIKKVADLLNAYKDIPFLFKEGRITICRADKKVIGVMITIANRIGARVQGDEGEYYDNSSNSYPESPVHLPMAPVVDINESEIHIPDDQLKFIGALVVGYEIQHAKFGKGKILEIISKGKDTELKIKFKEEIGTKRVLPFFAPIGPL